MVSHEFNINCTNVRLTALRIKASRRFCSLSIFSSVPMRVVKSARFGYITVYFPINKVPAQITYCLRAARKKVGVNNGLFIHTHSTEVPGNREEWS